MRSLLAVVLVLSVSACVVRVRNPNDGPPPPPGTRTDPVVVAPQQSELRVKEIKARRVFANVIYCKEIKADSGRIGEHRGWEGKGEWKGGGELKQEEVRADTIYAKEIKADWVEAAVVYCKEVKLGR